MQNLHFTGEQMGGLSWGLRILNDLPTITLLGLPCPDFQNTALCPPWLPYPSVLLKARLLVVSVDVDWNHTEQFCMRILYPAHLTASCENGGGLLSAFLSVWFM